MTTTRKASETTITPASRVSLGILWTLIIGVGSGVGGGGFFIAKLSGAVDAATQQGVVVAHKMDEVKDAVDRNTEKLIADGQALAIVQTLIKTMEARVSRLEDK